MMTAQQIQRLKEIEHGTPSYTSVTKKAFQGKSKAAGIKAKCLDCCCWQRSEIENCTATACPLWPYRPYQEKISRTVKALSAEQAERDSRGRILPKPQS